MPRIASLASLAILLGSASTAAAGGSYISLGVGGQPAIQGDVSTAMAGNGDGGNGRLALGLGVGRIGLEGSLSRFGFGSGTATAAGAHLRLEVPIQGAFGAYGRVGLEQVWLGNESKQLGSDTASGVAGGLGLQLTFEAPVLGQAGVWAEVSQDRFSTEMGSGGVRLWTLGMLFGI